MEPEEKDDFSLAFAEAIASDEKPKDDVGSEGTTSDEKPADDKPAEPKAADETGITPPEDKGKVDPVGDKPDEVVPTIKADPVAEPVVTTPKVVVPVAPKVEKKAPVQAEPEAPNFPDPILSADQKKVLDEFKKEFPDIATAQETQMQIVAQQLEAKFARALEHLVGRMYGDISPMAEMYAETAQNTFRGAVVKVHSDFDDVSPKLRSWIDTQPGYLQKSFNEVYDNGTAEEVIDLVQRYKEANGVKPQVPDPTPKPVVSSKKIDALTPVSGKRSVVATKGTDPNDYKGAFAEAIDSL